MLLPSLVAMTTSIVAAILIAAESDESMSNNKRHKKFIGDDAGAENDGRAPSSINREGSFDQLASKIHHVPSDEKLWFHGVQHREQHF
mmetsp:Transcript_43496/g.64539  ORF Transcript_43496/g.64539 Transcript_43496/m.64539 type:complete len:88 (+) Transcript_43496:88-351(+)